MISIYNFADITGTTHKEAGVDEIVADALSRNLEAIVVISSGNFSEAIQDEIDRKQAPLVLYTLIGEQPKTVQEIRIPQKQILRTKKERLDLVRSAGINLRIDDYTDFIPQEYGRYAEGILSSDPKYVICPVGSGKLWLSIVRKVEELGLQTRVIGITPRNKNGIYYEHFLADRSWNLSSVADKLTAPYTHLSAEVLSKSSRHPILEVSERQLKRAYRTSRKYTECEPSGAAAFIYLDQRFRTELGIKDEDEVTLVSTGIGYKRLRKEIQTESKVRTAGVLGTILTSLVAILTAGSLLIGQAQQEVENRETAAHYYQQTSMKGPMRYVAGIHEKSVFQLNQDEMGEAFMLWGMETDGLDFVSHSKDPRKLAMYEDFAMRCKKYHGCQGLVNWD